MSIIGFSSNPDEKIHIQIRKRNVSGELDVFEATQYFSDFNEHKTTAPRPQTQKQSTVISEQRQKRVYPDTEEQLKKQGIIKPSPPMPRSGGKLAGFFSSLLRSAGFMKSKSTPDIETRRRRRSCVVTNTWRMTAPVSGGGGACRANVPTRRSFDDKHMIYSCRKSESTVSREIEGSVLKEELSTMNRLDSWRCEKPKPSGERLGSIERVRGKSGNTGNREVDDGCESDSSDDLFELNLCEKKGSHNEGSNPNDL